MAVRGARFGALACALLSASACSPGLTPASSVARQTVEVAGRGQAELRVEVRAATATLVRLRSPDVDLVLETDTGGGALRRCAAPNRRLGAESLLLESDADARLMLRLIGEDHGAARGKAEIEVTALPERTADDRRRLEALRLEMRACEAYARPGEAAAAAEAYAAAAEQHRSHGDRAFAGLAYLHAAGASYAPLAEWETAARLAGYAARLLRRTGETRAAAYALRVKGAALGERAESAAVDAAAATSVAAAARELLSEAAEAFEALGDPYQAGYALNYRGVSHYNAGERALARADFERGLALFRRAGDAPAQALAMQSLAQLSFDEGRLQEAVRRFDEALGLIPRLEDPANYAYTLQSSALPLRALGRFDEAIARLHESGALLRTAGDKVGEARALHGIGTSFRHAGEPDRAREFLRAAIELRDEGSARREQALSLVVLGQIERDAGRLAEAIALHARAAALVTAPNDLAKARLALAQDQLAAGDLQAAAAELDAVLGMDLPPTHRHLGIAYSELGRLAALRGQAGEARAAFARAIQVHQANGSDLELAGTLLRRAEAAMRAGRTPEAVADTSEALDLLQEIGHTGTWAEGRAAFLAASRGAVDLRIAALLAQAAESQRQGALPDARRALRAAFATSDRFRALLLADEAASGPVAPALLERQREIYDLLAGKRLRQDRLLDRADPDDKELAELRRDIAWLRSEAQLVESAIARDRPATGGRTLPDDDELLLRLPEDARLAQFFLGPEHSWLFDVHAGNVTVHALPPREELERQARALHEAWSAPARRAGDRLAQGREFARQLLGPVIDRAGAERLLVVPDGALHLVPLAALTQALAPGRAAGTTLVIPALHNLQLRTARPEAQDGARLALVADPVYAADDPRLAGVGIRPALRLASASEPLTRGAGAHRALSRLPASGAEARAIAALLDDPARTTLLTGAEATRGRVVELLAGRHDIVHFATHAFADGQDPALAELALARWNARGEAEDGALRRADIARLPVQAGLVVLSACDTALGREIGGEGPIGLSQAFLRAGAESVVATLWQVPDTSTAALMQEFYRELLQERHPAALALSLAQERIRRNERWSDPYYWAGFQLVSLVP